MKKFPLQSTCTTQEETNHTILSYTMTTERSAKNPSVDEESSMDDSSSSCSDSSTESPPPDETVDAEQIRHNARVLLQSSPTGIKSDKCNIMISNSNTVGKTKGTTKYQSYQDAAPTVPTPTEDQLNTSNNSVIPQWGSTTTNDEGLSMTDVATMAFSCVAHCITESVRAASNYYDAYQHQETGLNNNTHNYEQVSGYHNDNVYNNNPNTPQHANYANNGYSDGYQTKSFTDKPSSQNREVMERGGSSTNNEQAASQSSGEQTTQKVEEWATVHVPSTYQGGRVGSGN